MESPKKKKQNNRREDEKRNPDSSDNAPTTEKEWDPESDIKDELTSEANKNKSTNKRK